MPPISIKKFELNGCQSFSNEIISNDRKLRGGPGMTGKIEPAIPKKEMISPRDKRKIDKAKSIMKKYLKLFLKLSDNINKH
jgi:hypothetical protein